MGDPCLLFGPLHKKCTTQFGTCSCGFVAYTRMQLNSISSHLPGQDAYPGLIIHSSLAFPVHHITSPKRPKPLELCLETRSHFLQFAAFCMQGKHHLVVVCSTSFAVIYLLTSSRECSRSTKSKTAISSLLRRGIFLAHPKPHPFQEIPRCALPNFQTRVLSTLKLLTDWHSRALLPLRLESRARIARCRPS